MANYRFSADIVDDVLFRAGEPTDGSSDFEATALQYINRAYMGIWMGGGELDPEINENWLWLKKDPPGILVLQPPITEGTVTTTNNNSSITFSVGHTDSLAGWHIRIGTDNDVFRIQSHAGGATNAILDAVYTGTTDSGKSFKAMKLEYTLATDVLNLITPMRVDRSNIVEIGGIELQQLAAEFPIVDIQAGIPDHFALITENSLNGPKIRFNKYGHDTDLVRIEYDYMKRPADLTNSVSEEPLIPRQYRYILADYALYMLYAVKNDQRAEGFGQIARSGLRAMARDNRVRISKPSNTMGVIRPRMRSKNFRHKVLRTESGFIIG